ncbi:hypothetical protein AAIH53_33040, partial [Pseudomonas aeruginosa]|uniref:hypothetical protein n=1 Tax=Pseudomonas aeruginosa TaxID=287 RepID=UPI0031B67DB9
SPTILPSQIAQSDHPSLHSTALVGAQCYAGWGGLIVLPVVEGKLGYIAAVAVGAVVTAVCVNVLKSLARKNGSSTEEKEDDLDLDFEIN